jgi:hypothetical protein
VKLDETEDAVTCLGWDLGSLGGGGEPGHEVQLASSCNLDHPREIDLAQLDRRAGQRADHGGGVLRVEQQPQPCKNVAHLRAREERDRVDLLAGGFARRG